MASKIAKLIKTECRMMVTGRGWGWEENQGDAV